MVGADIVPPPGGWIHRTIADAPGRSQRSGLGSKESGLHVGLRGAACAPPYWTRGFQMVPENCDSTYACLAASSRAERRYRVHARCSCATAPNSHTQMVALWVPCGTRRNGPSSRMSLA